MIDAKLVNPDWADDPDSWDGSVIRDDQGDWHADEDAAVLVALPERTPVGWSLRDWGRPARAGRNTPQARQEWIDYYRGVYRSRGPDPGVYNTLLRRNGVWSLPNPASPGHSEHDQWCADGLFLADVDFLLGAWMDRLHLGSPSKRSAAPSPSALHASLRVSRRAGVADRSLPLVRPEFQHGSDQESGALGRSSVTAASHAGAPAETPEEAAPPAAAARVVGVPPTASVSDEASDRARRRARQAQWDEEERIWLEETARLRRRWDAFQGGWDILFRGSSLAPPGSEVDVLERAARDADRRRRVEWVKSALFCQALLFLAPQDNWLWMADILHADNRVILCRMIASQASMSDATRATLIDRWLSAGWIDAATASKLRASAGRRTH